MTPKPRRTPKKLKNTREFAKLNYRAMLTSMRHMDYVA